jgi:hypothetical protein
MVFINGYYPDFKPAVYVVADDRAGGASAVQLLLSKGRKRIAGIFKSDDIQGHRGTPDMPKPCAKRISASGTIMCSGIRRRRGKS